MTDYIKTMRKYIGHERLLVVGAGVFIHKDGKLLMQKRRDNGCWAADHGSGSELSETVEETAKRELPEETGLTANNLELLGIFSGKVFAPYKMSEWHLRGIKKYDIAAKTNELPKNEAPIVFWQEIQPLIKVNTPQAGCASENPSPAQPGHLNAPLVCL